MEASLSDCVCELLRPLLLFDFCLDDEAEGSGVADRCFPAPCSSTDGDTGSVLERAASAELGGGGDDCGSATACWGLGRPGDVKSLDGVSSSSDDVLSMGSEEIASSVKDT